MITASDLIHLPFTPELIEAGIVQARRALSRLHSPVGTATYDAFRRTVAATALQLAFRRYLTEQRIAFRVLSPRIFEDPDRYDIEISGRTCILNCFLITRPAQIDALTSDPGTALRAPALVPIERYASAELSGDDLYVFALVTARIGEVPPRSRVDLRTSGRSFWLHSMPPAWMRPRTWVPLMPLALKSDSSTSVRLELTGEDADGAPLEAVVDAPPRRRVEVLVPLHTLSHVHAPELPAGRIGIHSSSHSKTHVIQPGDWHDVWLEGKDMFLLGWITREQFRMLAKLIPEGRRVFQFSRTKTGNLAIGAGRLRPILKLLDRASTEWHPRRKTDPRGAVR